MEFTTYLDIDITQQQLSHVVDGKVVRQYAVSTATNGAGELQGSECHAKRLA